MNNDELEVRQRKLLIRSCELRLILTDQTQVLKKPLVIIDQVRSGLQWLRCNPQWPLGAILLITIVRPRKSLVWGGRLLWTWNIYKRIKKWMLIQSTREFTS